jgi:hypothetical protein
MMSEKIMDKNKMKKRNNLMNKENKIIIKKE